MPESKRITVYSRDPCHLCDEAKATIHRVSDAVETPVSVDVVDVDADPELRETYGDRVPYVLVDGTPQFKYRVDEAELHALLE